VRCTPVEAGVMVMPKYAVGPGFEVAVGCTTSVPMLTVK
jgi:hypothetical protein